MATYAEMYDLSNNSVLLKQIATAVAVQADVIRIETPPANSVKRLAWAKAAISDPIAMGKSMQWAVIVSNRAFTNAQILGATDAAVLTAVAALVDIFAGT